MAVEGKTILQTTERTELTGKEGIPFQEGTQNGHVLVEKIKEYISSDVYICPGVFQITDGWSTTDVESIVGNWDEFVDAVNNKFIIIKSKFSEQFITHAPAMGATYYNIDTVNIVFEVFRLNEIFNYYITKEFISIIDNNSYIFSEDVIDHLNSTTLFPLSANQGRVLNEKIKGLITKTEIITESTKELQANTYYVFGEVETLTLTLAAGENGVMSEYMFEFTSGTTPTVITPIDGVEWRGDTIEANKVYQASIVRGIGILVGRDIV